MTPIANLMASVRRGHMTENSDAELLRAYAVTRDEESFRMLVERHGPMVLRVCRTVLRDASAADDAFQATFLVLARKAGYLADARPGAVAGWLYQTARRVALKARTTAARQRRRDFFAVETTRPRDCGDELSARELLAILDEELARLPGRYRLPLLLCFWQGLAQDEAARQLGISHGAIKGRLERGRAKLADRLRKRGLGTPALLLASLAGAAVPADLLARAVDVSAGRVPAAVAALARMATPGVGRRAVAVAVVILAGAIGIGVARPKAAPPVPEAPAKPQAKSPVDAAGDPLPAGAVARFGTIRFRSDSWADEVVASPDGKTLAVVGANSVLLWDAATGRELRRLGPTATRRIGNTGYSVRFAGLAFSPDGATLAAATADDSGEPCPVWVFDTITGRKLGDVPGHLHGTRGLTFLNDGRSLVTAGAGGIRVHEAATGREIRRLDSVTEGVSRLVASPDHRLVLVAGSSKKGEASGVWEVWDAAAGRLVHREAGLPSTIRAAAFSPDGKTVTVCGGIDAPPEEEGKAELRVWDLAGGKELRRWQGSVGRRAHLVSAAISPDGRFVATGGSDHAVRQWSVETGREVRPTIHPYRFAAKTAYLDNATLMTYGAQNAVHFWDAAAGTPLRQFEGGEAHLEALALSPDGRTVATGGGGGDATVRLWDVASGRQRLRLSGAMADLTGLAFSPDGKVVAASDSHGVVTLWDAADGRVRCELKGHKPWAHSVAFSPDGRVIATGDDANVVRLWDAATGVELRHMTGPVPAAVVALVFSPDSRTLFSAGWDHAIRQWDVATGNSVRVLQGTQTNRGADDSTGHTSVVTSLALSRDGRRLVSGSYDHTIRVWEVATGKTCRVVKSPNRERNSAVRSVALSPDGALLAAATAEDGRQHLIDVWDLSTGRSLAPLQGHTGQVTALAFTLDGRRLASISTDTTGLLWDVAAIRPAAPALGAAALSGIWDQLAAEPGPAYDAVRLAITGGDRTVALLRERLKPAAAVDTKRVAELLAALGSSRFAERERAKHDLAALGPGIEGELRKALQAEYPAEVSSRIRTLLNELASADLRTGRAVEVLEAIATVAARRLLTDLAAGASGATITRQASECLKRLDQR